MSAEGRKPCNREEQDIDFSGLLALTSLTPVSREEDVTNRLETILGIFSNAHWNLSGGIAFPQRNRQIIGKPNLVAQERNDVALGVGPMSEYNSPAAGKRAQVRRDNTATITSLYRMPLKQNPSGNSAFWQLRNSSLMRGKSHTTMTLRRCRLEYPYPSHGRSKRRRFSTWCASSTGR